MTTKNIHQTSDLAFSYFNEIKRLISAHNALFFDIGKHLKIVRDEKLYKALGDGGYDTWHSFLGSGDLGIGRSTVYAYIQLYEIYIEKYEFTKQDMSEIPYDKLRMALPRVIDAESKEQAEEWIYKAKELSRSDLLEELGTKRQQDKRVQAELCNTCNGYVISNPCRC